MLFSALFYMMDVMNIFLMSNKIKHSLLWGKEQKEKTCDSNSEPTENELTVQSHHSTTVSHTFWEETGQGKAAGKQQDLTQPPLHSENFQFGPGDQTGVGRGQRPGGDVQKREEAGIRKHRCLQHQELNISFKKEREIRSLAAEKDVRESFNPGQFQHKCHHIKGMTGPNKCISIILFLYAPFNEGCHLCSRRKKQQITWSSNNLQSCYGDKQQNIHNDNNS